MVSFSLALRAQALWPYQISLGGPWARSISRMGAHGSHTSLNPKNHLNGAIKPQ